MSSQYDFPHASVKTHTNVALLTYTTNDLIIEAHTHISAHNLNVITFSISELGQRTLNAHLAINKVYRTYTHYTQ